MSKNFKIFVIGLILINIGLITSYSGTWEKDVNGWWYKLENGSYYKNGWYQISENKESKWYYFNADGYMYSNSMTPDGYIVAQSGEQIIPGENYKDIVSNSKWEVKIYSQNFLNGNVESLN